MFLDCWVTESLRVYSDLWPLLPGVWIHKGGFCVDFQGIYGYHWSLSVDHIRSFIVYINGQYPLGFIPVVLCLDSNPVKEAFPLRFCTQYTLAAHYCHPFLGCYVDPARFLCLGEPLKHEAAPFTSYSFMEGMQKKRRGIIQLYKTKKKEICSFHWNSFILNYMAKLYIAKECSLPLTHSLASHWK